MIVGYARVSTADQDLAAQQRWLEEHGAEVVYVDHGFSGKDRNRPGLDQALAAVRHGDTLLVPRLDRLARSVIDAHEIAADLESKGAALSLGGTVYDPTDAFGKLFFGITSLFAAFERDLLSQRTREGMAIARANGKLRGRQPKLNEKQHNELRRMHEAGQHTIADLQEIFGVSRPSVYRALKRTRLGAAGSSVVAPSADL